MSEAELVPWLLAVFVLFIEAIVIVGLVVDHWRWQPKPDKSPREAREAGRRFTNNFTVPMFSGMGVAAGLIGGWLLPQGATVGDGGMVSFAGFLMVICAALQALVNWLVVVGEPSPDVFYGTPERIYLGLQELDVSSPKARDELRTMHEAKLSWRKGFGARSLLSFRVEECSELNGSLDWVPAHPDLGFRGACRVREVLRVIRVRRTAGYAKWVHWLTTGCLLAIVALLSVLVFLVQQERILAWILTLGLLFMLGVAIDGLEVVKRVRMLARQKHFQSLLDDMYHTAESRVCDVEERRRQDAEVVEQRLKRIESAVVRIERTLDDMTAVRTPFTLRRLFGARGR